MKYRITHITHYTYEGPIPACYNTAWMIPRQEAYQHLHQVSVTVDPQPAVLRCRKDFFGNETCFFALHQPHDHLRVQVVSEVERLTAAHQLDLSSQLSWEAAREQLHGTLSGSLDARQYYLPSTLIDNSAALAAYAQPSFQRGRGLYDAVRALMGRIHDDFEFDPGYTTVATPVLEVLEARRGVCQDFAQLAIGCIRSMGLAARYVSGYIETLPPPGQARLVGADASHAWFSVYIPGVGWRDFDPTNNLIPAQQHITVAWGRDYYDVPPLKGVIFSGFGHKLDVSVDVERI
ncbi:MAG: transglutaminase family protein [Bacteroidia bacterium]